MDDKGRKEMEAASMERIAHWLLSPGVQREEPSHRGGIAGWLCDEGTCDFVYGEMSGYYLSFLAYLREFPSGGIDAEGKISATLLWIESFLRRGQLPSTRDYLRDRSPREETDWRCDYRFSFDNAMIWRGMGLGPISGMQEGRRLQTLFLDPLGVFFGEDQSLSPIVRRRDNGNAVYRTWSTAVGSYQLKVAAALDLFALIDLPGRWRNACRNVYEIWQGRPDREFFCGHLHADLYALEGLLLFGLHRHEEALSLLARRFTVLWQPFAAGQETALGEGASRTGPEERTDVLAQFLRLGCCLVSLGWLDAPSWMPRLRQVSRSLEQRIGPHGGVAFRTTTSREVHWNVWCAIFSFQALHYFSCLERHNSVPLKAMKLLI